VRVVVIGGTGHIGSYLVPRLVELGHEVVSISRGARRPYLDHGAWSRVESVQIDRTSAEKQGDFARAVVDLEPEAVIDLICFTAESAQQLVQKLSGRIQHYLFCGTIWIYGHSTIVPATEEGPRNPFGPYGINKALAERYLLTEARLRGFPATCLHPGHIVGPGWVPVNPAGNFNPTVFARLASGQAVVLPNLGMETLHHVHADDVAQAFVRALAARSVAIGESFHVVSPNAVTLRGYAEAVASWFGRDAVLEFLPWEQWKVTASEEEARATWDHIAHSPNASIDKARRLLGYDPRYSSFEAVRESVLWLHEQGRISST